MNWLSPIVLVNPPLAVAGQYCLSPPMGLLLLSRALLVVGRHAEEVVDLSLELAEGKIEAGPRLPKDCAVRLASIKAATYCFSVQCVTLPIAIAVAKHLASLCPEARIVFGGHQITALKDSLLRFPYISEVIAGSAERYLIPGFQPGDWISPDYTRAPHWQRYAHVSRQATGLVEVSRGCPYECSFCSIPVVFGRTLQHKPVSVVLDEVQYLQTQGCNEIHFVDDVFTLDRKHVGKLIEALGKLSVKPSWTTMTRADLVDSAILQKMAAAGCHSILYGIESGSERTLVRLNKRASRYPDLVQMLLWNIECGIAPTFYFLVNLPDDTEADLCETLNVVSRLSVIDPGCCRLQLPRFTPGTGLTRAQADPGMIDRTSPYARSLSLTVGESRDVWSIVENNADLCTTYYRFRGPLHPDLAEEMAWSGHTFFERFPILSVLLASKRSLLHFFEVLAASCQNERHDSAKNGRRITRCLKEMIDQFEPALREVFAFEAWRAGEAGSSPENEIHMSRVCPERVAAAAVSGLPSLDEALSDISTVFRRTTS